MVQTDFGHQPLKAGPTLGTGTGTAQILIDQEELRGDQPSSTARSTKVYYSRVDSWWCSTCCSVDSRT